MRREIGIHMQTDGIRRTERFWMMKSTKWGIDSMNGYPTEFGITFVFKKRRNGGYNGQEREVKMYSHGRITFELLT